jgi:peptide/nickel transport system substrate-binding protein
MAGRLGRRALLLGAAGAAIAASSVSRIALARGRTPIGGRVAMHVPWPLGAVDPHRIDDVAAALFGDALFDTLYARDESGAFVASLAENDPEADGASLRVLVRAGVRFASGRVLDARAVAGALARARAGGAGPWLADVPVPRVDGASLVFATKDAHLLVHALASPLAAITAPRFQADRPDGTGPFRAEVRGDAIVLARNPLAARGPAFLDEIVARHAPDISTSLRAFETGADDIGWLGSFLHEPRAGARLFDAAVVAWAVLRTGKDAGAFDAPGVAQSIADGVPHAMLAPFVIGAPWEQGATRGWTGAPCDLLVRDDAPWLLELAKALAAALSSSSHEVTARPVTASEIAQRRASRAFVLILDVARPVAQGPLGVLAGLATADDPSMATGLVRHPPRGGDLSPRVVTRMMRIGVVGEIRLQGGRAPDLVLPASPSGFGIDFGAAFRARR